MRFPARSSLRSCLVAWGALAVAAQQGLPPRAPRPPLASLSDFFDGAALDPSWTLHNPQLMSYSISGGELHLSPLASGPSASWFADGEGPALFKEVTGDFDVRASVRAYSASNPAAPPPPEYRLGGLIVRDPASAPGARNSAHVVVGAGSAAFPVAAEDKTTVDSQSDYRFYPIAQAAGQVRIARRGDLISLYYRASGQNPWQLLRSHNRPDLPATVQVGPMLYSISWPPDVAVSFGEVEFR